MSNYALRNKREESNTAHTEVESATSQLWFAFSREKEAWVWRTQEPRLVTTAQKLLASFS